MGVWLEWRGVLRVNEDPGQIGIWCPGCMETHVFDQRWAFNGNHEKPTFTPSLKVTNGHYVSGTQLRPDGKCGWCEDAKEDGHASLCGVCHSFVTDGRIQFLTDCTHAMAGQTVPLTVRPAREE